MTLEHTRERKASYPKGRFAFLFWYRYIPSGISGDKIAPKRWFTYPHIPYVICYMLIYKKETRFFVFAWNSMLGYSWVSHLLMHTGARLRGFPRNGGNFPEYTEESNKEHEKPRFTRIFFCLKSQRYANVWFNAIVFAHNSAFFCFAITYAFARK